MALHFVGFKDDRIHTAIKIFGKPDFYHLQWDMRAYQEIAPDDIIIFANNISDQLPPYLILKPKHSNSWDDSRQDIIARGGEKGIDYI